MALLLSGISLLTLLLWLIALFLFCRRREYGLAEAVNYAIVGAMAFFSAAFQLLFLIKLYHWSYFLDILLILLSLYYIIKYKDLLYNDILAVKIYFRKNFLTISPFLLIFTYLGFQSLTLPPLEYDSLIHNLPRVLLMMQEGSLFLTNYSTFNQVGFFLGGDILHFLFLRWHSDWGLGTFSFLSYLAVITGTYALVRLHGGEEPRALLTAFIIASLVELVLQSTSTKNDIPLTAVTTTVLLAATRVLTRQDPSSWALLATSLALGSGMKAYFLGFSLPFALLFLTVCRPRPGGLGAPWPKRDWLLFLLPLVLVLQLGLFMGMNQVRHGSPFGTAANVGAHRNPDGWRGALANASRYALQILSLPRELGGQRLEDWHTRLWGDLGKAPGSLLWHDPHELSRPFFRPPLEFQSWYGPWAVLLCLPALGYALIRGPAFHRLTAAALLSFAAALCWQIGWMPWNNRFFSLFFGGSGVCVGRFLDRRVPRRYDRLMWLASLVFLSYAAFFNHLKPLVDTRMVGLFLHRHLGLVAEMAGKGERDPRYHHFAILPWLDLLMERDLYFRRYYRDERVAFYRQHLRPRARLLFIADELAWTFPWLLTRPDVFFLPANPGRLPAVAAQSLQKSGLPSEFDYVLVARVNPPAFLDPKRLVFRGWSWRNEQGDPEGEDVWLFDYGDHPLRLPGVE